jgi:hypothetical protein
MRSHDHRYNTIRHPGLEPGPIVPMRHADGEMRTISTFPAAD